MSHHPIATGRWLTRDRVIAAGWALALAQATGLVMLALWQHGIIADGISRTSSDFVSFYAAGKLALAGTPALAYDREAHFAAEQLFTVTGAPYQFFFYPPVFMLLCAPLALLPYHASFYGFEITTLLAFLWTVRRILNQSSWSCVGPVLAVPAIFWNFGLGQNAFLTAALLAGFTSHLNRRPVLAGVLLGLLCYKPHFGLLAPVALLAGAHWRAFFAAGATVAGLVLLSAGLFGIDSWLGWLEAVRHSDAVYSAGRIDYAGILTPFGAARLMGVPAQASYAIQGVFTAVMVVIVAATWWRTPSFALRAAVLLAAMPLAVPLLLLYDTLPSVLAIGWMVRDAQDRGAPLTWEKLVLAAAWVVSLWGYAISSAWNIPAGPLVSLTILLLVLRAAAGQVSPARPLASGSSG